MTNTKTGTASDVPSGLGSGTLNADGRLVPTAPPLEAFTPPLSVASPADATARDWWLKVDGNIPQPQHSAFLGYLDRIAEEDAAPARVALAAVESATAKVRALVDEGLELLDRMADERESARDAAADAILASKKTPAPFDADAWALAMSRKASQAGPLVGAASAAVAGLDAELLALGAVVRGLVVADLAENATKGREAASLAAACVERDEALRLLLDVADYADSGVLLGEMAQRRRNALRDTDGFRAAVRHEGTYLGAANALRDVLTSEATVAALAEWKPGDTA